MILLSIFAFVNLSPLALLGEGGEAGIDKQLASFRVVAKHSGQYLETNSILRIISLRLTQISQSNRLSVELPDFGIQFYLPCHAMPAK